MLNIINDLKNKIEKARLENEMLELTSARLKKELEIKKEHLNINELERRNTCDHKFISGGSGVVTYYLPKHEYLEVKVICEKCGIVK